MTVDEIKAREIQNLKRKRGSKRSSITKCIKEIATLILQSLNA